MSSVQIFDSAFNFEAAGGGLLGGLIFANMMIGIKTRSVFQ